MQECIDWLQGGRKNLHTRKCRGINGLAGITRRIANSTVQILPLFAFCLLGNWRAKRQVVDFKGFAGLASGLHLPNRRKCGSRLVGQLAAFDNSPTELPNPSIVRNTACQRCQQGSLILHAVPLA